MMRKVSTLALGIAIGAGVVTLAGESRWLSGLQAEAAPGDTYRKLNLFGDIFEQVRTNYVEQPDEGKMIDSAINGMLASLDPHSTYLDPKATQELQNSTSGRFRWPWHRGHVREQSSQGRHPDRRYARLPRRGARQ